MADILDTSLRVVVQDRPALARLLRAVQLDQGDISWIGAYDGWQEGVAAARTSRTPTVRTALTAAACDPEYVSQVVHLLERRDQAASAAYAKAAGPIMLEAVDPARGMVLLDQGDQSADGEPATDPIAYAAKALVDPVEQETRYLRVRKLTGSYEGPDGRKRFLDDDRVHLTAGLDLVRSIEREREEGAARAAADQVARQLDQAIAEAGKERGKLKQLEADIAKLGDPAVREVAGDQLRLRMGTTNEPPLRLLDQLANGEPAAEPAGPPGVDEMDARVRERLRRLGRPERDYVIALEQEGRGEPMPPAPESAPPDTPRGVDPGSHELDRRVRDRMRKLDRNPESDYIRTLDEIRRAEGVQHGPLTSLEGMFDA